MTAQILEGITAAEYYADPCVRLFGTPSLSQSCGTTIVTRSAYHGWLEHPQLGKGRGAYSDSLDAGSTMHSLVLDGGKGIEIIQAENYRTKDAQRARDAARAAGRVPILRDDYEDEVEIAEAVKEELARLGLPLTGRSECPVTWEEESSLGPVRCRGMFDHVWFDEGMILDLKRTQIALPDAIARQVYSYGLDIQREAYTRALAALRPEHTGRVDFVFAFVEVLPRRSKPRVLITPVRLGGQFRKIGEGRWNLAVETWAQCRKSGVWPAYTASKQPITVEPPKWVLYAEEERLVS